MPGLLSLTSAIDRLNEWIGRATAWTALLLVLVQFAIVILRYVFGLSYVFAQESLLYLHSWMFLAGAGYTFLHDGHVRVDIFYRAMPQRRQALVDLAGTLAFLLPLCGFTMWLSWPFVANSWAVLEGSPETSGIQAVFLLKSMILVFAALVGIQAVSVATRAALAIKGQATLRHEEKPHGV